jgi:hypothetical protein
MVAIVAGVGVAATLVNRAVAKILAGATTRGDAS